MRFEGIIPLGFESISRFLVGWDKLLRVLRNVGVKGRPRSTVGPPEPHPRAEEEGIRLPKRVKSMWAGATDQANDDRVLPSRYYRRSLQHSLPLA